MVSYVCVCFEVGVTVCFSGRCSVVPAIPIGKVLLSVVALLTSLVIKCQYRCGFISGVFSVPLIYLSVFRPVSPNPDYYSFMISLEIKEYKSFNLILFKDCFGYTGFLHTRWFHINYRISLSISKKKNEKCLVRFLLGLHIM